MLRSRWITALLICFCGAFLTTTLCGGKRDNEEDLKTHIQSEHNPVKKAKIQIRLAKLQLNQAEASYNQGQTEQGAALLGVYASTMQDAWEALRQSGRNGARQPQGFKELELALREGTRRLEDLKHRISYYDREPRRHARARHRIHRPRPPGRRYATSRRVTPRHAARP